MRTLTLHNTSALSRRLNGLLTILLLGLMLAMGAVLGNALFGRWGLLLAAGFAIFALMSSSSAAPRIVLSIYRARPISPLDSPDLYDMVAELARRADLPAIPSLYLSPHVMPNALSVGQPSQPIVVLTRGLLARLDGRELAGVLAHEVAHIRNRDLWLLGLADSIQRLTRGLSTFGMVLLLLSLPLLALGAATVPFDLVMLLIFAPLLSVLAALALSRTREFEADRTAAELTGDPLGLASALRQIDRSQRTFWDLFLPRPQTAGSRLWRTHPAAEERIRRLLA